MAKRADLLAQMAALAADLDRAVAPAVPGDELRMLCHSARLAFGAAAASVASLTGGVLTYRAASGEGADAIVGTELPVSRGIAGYVAVTGQAMAIDRPVDDARFARDVAERTGYVPDSLLVVPISSPLGGVAGVLSVLDRSVATVDALGLASAFAAQASARLIALEESAAAVRVVLAGVIDAASAGDAELAAGLRRATRTVLAADRDLAELAMALAGVRRLDEATRARTMAVITEVIELATRRRGP